MNEEKRFKALKSRIRGVDVYKYIACRTGLTKKQVTDCFKEYADMISNLVESEFFDLDTEITLPQIGRFYFIKKNGKKSGSTYKIPQGHDIITKTVEKDRPDYFILNLRFYKKFMNHIKKETIVDE